MKPTKLNVLGTLIEGIFLGAIINVFFNSLGFNYMALLICASTLVVYAPIVMYFNHRKNLEEQKAHELDMLRSNSVHDNF